MFFIFFFCFFVRFRIEQPVYINIIRDPINRFLSNYFFRRFGDWRGEQNHLIRTPGMKDDERYLVRAAVNYCCLIVWDLKRAISYLLIGACKIHRLSLCSCVKRSAVVRLHRACWLISCSFVAKDLHLPALKMEKVWIVGGGDSLTVGAVCAGRTHHFSSFCFIALHPWS